MGRLRLHREDGVFDHSWLSTIAVTVGSMESWDFELLPESATYSEGIPVHATQSVRSIRLQMNIGCLLSSIRATNHLLSRRGDLASTGLGNIQSRRPRLTSHVSQRFQPKWAEMKRLLYEMIR